jgi:lipoprotein-anchoring transpeptidase ErfK/SrfK
MSWRSISRWTACALAVALIAAAAAPAVTTKPARRVVLSNERTLSRWVSPNERAAIRSAPRGNAHVITRLHFWTEDRAPELYLALESRFDAHNAEWVKIRVPRRPNGTTGWVRRAAVGPYQTVRTQLVVDRRRLWATLYQRGRVVWSARVGVGKRSTPTPAGHFYVRERLNALGGGTIYGPLAFGTSAYSRLSDWPRGGIIGIHGTNEPNLIPGHISHGCIRLRNSSILRLSHWLRIGTPVLIR